MKACRTKRLKRFELKRQLLASIFTIYFFFRLYDQIKASLHQIEEALEFSSNVGAKNFGNKL